jgi:5-methylcytosine-specific restriction endonuclease McrA
MQARIEGTEFVPARTVRTRFRQSIFEAWEHRCAYCGNLADSLDHIVPKVKGGQTVRGNLAPACLTCNRRKSHHEVISWWRQQPYWTEVGQERLIDWVLGS